MLLRDGVITHEQLQAVLNEQARRRDRRLGELLVERGMLAQDVLGRYIRVQIEEAVYALFTWSSGSFYFEVDQRPEANEYLTSLNAESLLLEAARRVDEWSLIEKKIPSMDLLFDLELDRLQAADLELTPEQERIVPLLDGFHTVQDLVEETGLGEFEVGKALFGLIQAGFAHRTGRRAAEEAPRARESEIRERKNLGVAFYRSGLLAEAAQECRRTLELRPSDVGARFHLGLIAVRRGDAREAVRQLKALVEALGPRYAAFVDLAIALQRLGRRDDALLVLGEAETLRPRSAHVSLLRALLLLESGEIRRAEEALDEYRARVGKGETPSAAYYHARALAAAVTGRREEARALVAEGLDAHPRSAPLLVLAAAVAERNGMTDPAERQLRAAAEEDPELPQVHKGLGDLAYRRGAHDEALEHYQRALGLDAALGDDVYAKIGNIHFKRGAREDALAAWQKALELNPGNQIVRGNLEIATYAGS